MGDAYINQKLTLNNNFILKKMLNNIKNVDILKDFLESILEIKISNIILKPSLKEESESIKNHNICSLKVFTEKGNEINIGIQIINGCYIESKILLYCANIYKEIQYSNNEKIVTINILDFKYLNSKSYHTKFELYRNSIQEAIYEIHILELPKFTITNKENITKKEVWIAFLNGDDKIIDFNNKEYKQIKILNNLLNNYWKSEIL